MQTEHNVDQTSHGGKCRLTLQCLKLYNKAMDHLGISRIHPCERPGCVLAGNQWQAYPGASPSLLWVVNGKPWNGYTAAIPVI